MRPVRQQPFRELGLLSGRREPILSFCIPAQGWGSLKASFVLLQVDREVSLKSDHQVEHEFQEAGTGVWIRWIVPPTKLSQKV